MQRVESETSSQQRRANYNIARMFGGNLPQNRTALVPSETMEVRHEVVLSFPSHPPQGKRLVCIAE